MARFRCPTCGKRFESEVTPTVPFCSERCQRIDLGRWLGEQHGVPLDDEARDDHRRHNPNSRADESDDGPDQA